MSNLPPVIYWVIFFLIAIALFKFMFLNGRGGKLKFPYKKSGPLFSTAERSLLGVLDMAIGQDYRIMGKVRVADVVEVSGTVGRSAWQTAFNRISSKHFDYVLCDKESLTVTCVIELNDKSHNGRKRQKRDEFLEGVCKAANLPLVTIPAKAGYSVQEIRDSVQAATNPAPIQIEARPNAA
jgi:hypothetical protein